MAGRIAQLLMAAPLVHTVLFLTSEGGSFYTGQTFSPNGGDTMP